MKQFQNILFVIQDNHLSPEALNQALPLVRHHKASFSFLVLRPAFGKKLDDIASAYEHTMSDQIQSALTDAGWDGPVTIHFESQKPHFVSVIRHVLKSGHDLVIKAAEAPEDKGFKSLDMSLLRKCPCPLWLCRPAEETSGTPTVLTAIDPVSDTVEGHDLSLKLLNAGQSLARIFGARHDVISCWHYQDEEFLRNSPFAKMDTARLDGLVAEAEQEHKDALDRLITESGIEAPTHIHCLKGKAETLIPALTEQEQIPLIVMGTVARTAIPGFIIGNTAEGILQSLSCGMFAAKPNGFVSPVKAY